MKTLPLFVLLCASFAIPANGGTAAFWGDLMRSASKGDDAFMSVARGERVAAEIAGNPAARRMIRREVGDVADAATRTRRLKDLLEATLHHPDPALVREIGRLAPAEMEAAFVLARGSRKLVETAPDVAARARLLDKGGSDLVAAIGLHGDDLAREATRLDLMVGQGALQGRIGSQPTLGRFSEVMRSGDGGAWKFWQTNVVPNWKKWLAGGAVATYLVNPELFHDAAGRATEEGARRLSEIVGSVASGTLTGAAEGGEKAVWAVWNTIATRYLHNPAAWPGLLLLIWVVGMLVPRTRRICLAPVTWLFRKS